MRIAYQLNKILEGEDNLPTWMTYGRTILCQKDPAKGNAVENYRPITCLPLMWKLLTGMIAEEMYTYLNRESLDNVGKKIHWELCKKHGLEHKEKWYEHNPEGVAENEGIKVLWDMNIQCDNVIEARRPDIIIIIVLSSRLFVVWRLFLGSGLNPSILGVQSPSNYLRRAKYTSLL